jgi:hypothetical protein
MTPATNDREPVSTRFLRVLSRGPAPSARFEAPEI